MAKAYTAMQGDTWEYVSWRAYGSSHYVKFLMWNNFHLRHIEKFSGGEMLLIPDLPTEEKTSANLPPWREQ